MTRHQHYVAIVGCALIRRYRSGGHRLVAGVRCKRPVDLLAQLPKRVIVAGVRCKHPVDLLAQLPVNEDFGARHAVIASMTRHQHYVAIVGCALIRRYRSGGHRLVAGVRCKHPVDLLAQLPVNEDFGARHAVIAAMTRHQHYVAIVGCALIRRYRSGGHRLVAGVRCKRPVDLLAQRPKGVIVAGVRCKHPVDLLAQLPERGFRRGASSPR